MAPMSPYGETKLVGEWMLRDLAAASRLRWAALRYFNVAGAGAPELADRSVNNLVPMTFQALDRGPQPAAVRRRLRHPRRLLHPRLHPRGRPGRGARRGCPAARRGPARRGLQRRPRRGRHRQGGVPDRAGGDRLDFTVDVVGRRAGDPAAYFADASKIAAELGWTARLDLRDMVQSAWEAWQSRGQSPR